MKRALAILTVAFLLFGGVVLLFGGNDADGDNGKTPTPDGAGIVLIAAGKGCDQGSVVTRALREQGFQDGEFVIGADRIDWNAPEANERGATAFSSETPKSAKAVVKELSSDNDKAKAALAALQKQSGAAKEQLLNPSNWVAAQLNVPSNWAGNTQFKGGKAVSAKERKSASGDVVWMFVHPDVCVQVVGNPDAPASPAVTAHRAGCGNPQMSLPVPAQPSVPTTPTTPETPTTPSGGKNPAETSNRNSAVPAQVRKTGESVDNASRIAEGSTTPEEGTPTRCPNNQCGGTTPSTTPTTPSTVAPVETPATEEGPSSGTPPKPGSG